MCFFSSFVLFYALITPECMIGISCQWVILSYILSIVVISRVCALNRIKNQYEIRVWYIFVRLFVCLFCICFFLSFVALRAFYICTLYVLGQLWLKIYRLIYLQCLFLMLCKIVCLNVKHMTMNDVKCEKTKKIKFTD